MNRFQARLRRFVAETRGAAAAEFGLVVVLIATMMMNVVDLGRYAYDSMQVASAGQALAQQIWNYCPSVETPVTTICLQSANTQGPLTAAIMNTAVQSTKLGSNVTASSLTEAWYCVDNTGKLVVYSSNTSSPPTGVCSSGGNTNVAGNNNSPGDYITFTVSYTFHPIFGHTTIASLLPSTISKPMAIRVN